MSTAADNTTPALFTFPTDFWAYWEIGFGAIWGAYVRLNEFHDINCESATISAIDSWVIASRFWNTPDGQRSFPQNTIYIASPIMASKKLLDAYETCMFQSAWWQLNTEPTHPDLVPCPEWWSDAQPEADNADMLLGKMKQSPVNRHWCYVREDGEYEEADMEEEEEEKVEDDEPEDDGFLMAKLRQRLRQAREEADEDMDEEEDNVEDPGNDGTTAVMLGHEWDFEWMIHAFGQDDTTKDKTEDFVWHNVNEKRKSVAANPYQLPDDESFEYQSGKIN